MLDELHRPAPTPARQTGVPAPAPPGAVTPPAFAPDGTPPSRYRRAAAPVRYAAAATAGAAWLAGAGWLAQPWWREVGAVTGPGPAVLLGLAAVTPTWLAVLLLLGRALERHRPADAGYPTDPVTVLVTARDGYRGVEDTLLRIAHQDHQGPVRVLLTGPSAAESAAAARATAHRLGLSLAVAGAAEPDAAHVPAGPVITVDAGTLPHRAAVRQLVAGLAGTPAGFDGVAGTVLVRNSRQTIWTRLQEWDRLLGLAAGEPDHGSGSPAPATGGSAACRTAGGLAAYRTATARADGRFRPQPLALAFADVPARLPDLVRYRISRARWTARTARLRPPWRADGGAPASGPRLLEAARDVSYSLVWLPGLLLAGTGWYAPAVLYALLVLPAALAVDALAHRVLRRRVFDRLGLRVRRNWTGFVLHATVYHLLLAPVSVFGHVLGLLDRRR